MLGTGVYCWAWDYAAGVHRQLSIDAANLLQVDIAAAVALDSHCWGYDGANWQELRVESAASPNLRARLYDGANGVDASLMTTNPWTATGEYGLVTRSVINLYRSAAPYYAWAAAIGVADGTNAAAVGPVALWGYNGASWDRLRVESATAFNLRTRLYDGANGVNARVSTLAAYDPSANYHLLTMGPVYLHGAGNSGTPWRRAVSASDGDVGNYFPPVSLMGFNGASYDRLRVYATGILKVCRAEGGLSDSRLIAVGNVAAGTRRLYWITINPSGVNWDVQITDAIAAGGAVKWDIGSAADEGKHCVFDPPLEFSVGIRLEAIVAITSVIFGYM